MCVYHGSCRFSMSDFSVKQKKLQVPSKIDGLCKTLPVFIHTLYFLPLALSVCLFLPVSDYLPPPPHSIPLFYHFKWQQHHKKWLWYYDYTYSVEYKQHSRSLVSQNFKPSYWTSLNMYACMGTCTCFYFNFCKPCLKKWQYSLYNIFITGLHYSVL